VLWVVYHAPVNKIEALLYDPKVVDFVHTYPWLVVAGLAIAFTLVVGIPVFLRWPKSTR